MGTKNTAVFRHGRVMAYHSKWTGEEPEWTGWEKLTAEEFRVKRVKMLDFYNYYLGSKELQPDLIVWMKANGYAAADISALQAAPDWLITQTAGKLARAINRGMPPMHPQSDVDDTAFIRGHVNAAVAVANAEYKPAPTVAVAAAPTISLRERLANKVESTVGMALDVMIDAWTESGNSKIGDLDIRAVIKGNEIPGAGCSIVLARLNKLRKEFSDCEERIDDQAIASYAHLSKKAVALRIAAIDSMIAEVQKLNHSAKSARKPRIKKEKSADKQVARIKYMISSKEFGIDSIPPVKAVGASKIVVFNTKYRILQVFVTDKHTGLTFKGAAINDFDTTKSYGIKLRKPNEVLPKIIGPGAKNLDKVIELLKTDKKPANPRFGEALVIVSVYT
jgi:hypothetical protein